MCPKTAGFVNTPPERVISMDVVDKLQPVLWAIGGVDLSGLWGEAFLFPDLYVSILRRLKRNYVGVRTVSNGSLLTRELAKEIVMLGLDGLEISVDAAREETYRRLRAGGELSRVIEGLRCLNTYKKEFKKKRPAVRLTFLGMKDNIHEFPEFIRLAHGLEVGTVVLQAMGEYEAVKGRSIALGAREEGRRWLREARKESDRLGVSIELFPPDQFETPKEGVQSENGGGFTKDCLFPWDRAVVTTTGEVLPCCAAPGPFGDLKKQSFEEIWYGPQYSKLRASIMEGRLPLMCRTCTGQAWRGKSLLDGAATIFKLEKIRARQMLRSSPALRKMKNLIKGTARS